MAETNTFHTEKFTIRANEVDVNGNTTLKAICSFFQEVAGNNAKALNFDITDLHEDDRTWVLHRMDIKIDTFPKWRETITIETWPAAGDALRAFRNYRILDEYGTELGCCLSYWMMLNLKTRRPIRMTKEILNTRLSNREHVLKVKANRISPITDPKNKIIYNVRRSDLDMNLHVNNATYIDWMLENLSSKESSSIKTFDIVYMNESLEGDQITSTIEMGENGYRKLQLVNQNNEIVALAEVLIK
ncbi:MAG: thioesterase [Balneolaceae bacterium]